MQLTITTSNDSLTMTDLQHQQHYYERIHILAQLREFYMSGDESTEAALLRTKIEFQSVLDSISDAFVTLDNDDRYVYVNQAAERILGISRDEMLGKVIWDIFPVEQVPEFYEAYKRTRLEQEQICMEQYFHDGIWLENRIFPTPNGLAIYFRDITRQKKDQDELKQREARFRAALKGSMDAFYLLEEDNHSTFNNPDFRFVDCNGLGLQLLGRSIDVRGKTLRELSPAFLSTLLLKKYHAAKLHSEAFEEEFSFYSEIGELIWIRQQVVPAGDCLAVTMRDITEKRMMEDQQRDIDEHIRKRLEESNAEQRQQLQKQFAMLQNQAYELELLNRKLEGLAYEDGLTGLKNHRAFQDALNEEHSRAQRYNSNFSMMIIDVDDFKKYNDTFGHPSGDQVLKQVARLLRSFQRATDFVARYGGEEFAILLPETDANGAMDVAERLRKLVEDHAWEKRSITISIGVSTMSTSTNPAVLLEESDQALYRSKKTGKNRVTHYAIRGEN